MVTRSQSLAKRKADEAASDEATKSVKTSPSDDTSTSRRKPRSVKKTSKTTKEKAANAKRKLAGVPEETAAEKGSTASSGKNGGTIRPRGTWSGASSADGSTSRSGKSPEASPDQQVEKQDREAERSRSGTSARRIVQLLQLNIERERIRGGCRVSEKREENQLSSVLELCSLASSEADVHQDPCLARLPRAWWDDLGALGERLRKVRELLQSLNEAAEEFNRRDEIYDAAVARRGESYLGFGMGSGEDERRLCEDVLEAREPWREARSKWGQTRNRYEDIRNATLPMMRHVLYTAESVLVSEGYLRSWSNLRSVTLSGNSQIPTRDDDRQSAFRHEPYRSVRGGSSSSGQPVKSSVVRRMGLGKTILRPVDASNEAPSGSVEDILGNFRSDQKKDLERKKAAYQQSLKKFHAIRNGYNRDLAACGEKQDRNAVRGTRTDFDHSYYLTRGNANHEVAVARDHYEFAFEQAELVGALTNMEKIMMMVNSEPDDATPEDEPAMELLQELTHERVEGWRQDEQQKDVVGEERWAEMVPSASQGWGSVQSVGSVQGLLEEEERYALGERRRTINGWQREQQKLRQKTAFAIVPSMAPKGAELRWFEGWNGL